MKYSLDRVWFDLDGTLIDSSNRMYKLFQDLVPESRLTKDEYWALKRDKVNHREILQRYFPKYLFEDFNSEWMRLIEADSYLMLDKLYPETKQILERLQSHYNVILITARQSKDGLYNELQSLDVVNYFDNILVTEGAVEKKILTEQFCEKYGSINSDKDFLISDMGKDILYGNELGFTTIGITHGFMSEKHIANYRPTYIIKNLLEIFDLVDA